MGSQQPSALQPTPMLPPAACNASASNASASNASAASAGQTPDWPQNSAAETAKTVLLLSATAVVAAAAAGGLAYWWLTSVVAPPKRRRRAKHPGSPRTALAAAGTGSRVDQQAQPVGAAAGHDLQTRRRSAEYYLAQARRLQARPLRLALASRKDATVAKLLLPRLVVWCNGPGTGYLT